VTNLGDDRGVVARQSRSLASEARGRRKKKRGRRRERFQEKRVVRRIAKDFSRDLMLLLQGECICTEPRP